MTRTWFVGWTALVGTGWVVLAGVFADGTCSDRAWFCLTFESVLMFLFIPAAKVWVLGLFLAICLGACVELARGCAN